MNLLFIFNLLSLKIYLSLIKISIAWFRRKYSVNKELAPSSIEKMLII